MEVNIRDKRLLMSYHHLKTNWKKEECIVICMRDESRGILWWKVRVWRLKGFKMGIKTDVCLICRKEEELWHVLNVTEWKEKVLDKR
jgi:hypothetical protein